MALRTLDEPGPIEAVLFDLHSTLVDQGDPRAWLELAWGRAGRGGTARAALGDERFERVAAWLDRIWEHGADLDPRSERDLSPARHREVFDRILERLPDVDPALAHALYGTMLETWAPYDDAAPTLRELRRRGVRTALVSNIGVDARPVLDRGGIGHLLDAVVLSCEVGVTKPGAGIFERALAALGAVPLHALMVGDNAGDDAGAARLGIRTLLLPRTRGRVHGLDVVLRLVGP